MRSLFLALLFAAPVFAEQPACTADRHLDECGQLCPDSTTTTTIVSESTTTTTEPSVNCPDPAPCQPVVCTCQDGASTTVTVDRCPAAPLYVPCNVHRKYRKGDVKIDGQWAHCARAGAPHRVFFPKVNGSY